jgi:hypothetical protein
MGVRANAKTALLSKTPRRRVVEGFRADSQPDGIDGANEIFSVLKAHVEKLI